MARSPMEGRGTAVTAHCAGVSAIVEVDRWGPRPLITAAYAAFAYRSYRSVSLACPRPRIDLRTRSHNGGCRDSGTDLACTRARWWGFWSLRDGAGDGSLMRPMVGTLLPALRGGASSQHNGTGPRVARWDAPRWAGFPPPEPWPDGWRWHAQAGRLVSEIHGWPQHLWSRAHGCMVGVWSGYAVRRGMQWLGRPCDCVPSARSVGQCRRIAQFHGESGQ